MALILWRSTQSILKEISRGIYLEGMMLKLKLLYFGHLLRRVDSFEKTLMLGKIEGRGEGDGKKWDGWMASPTWWTWVWVDSRSWWWTGRPGVLRFMGSQQVGHDWATELNWTKFASPSNAGGKPSLTRQWGKKKKIFFKKKPWDSTKSWNFPKHKTLFWSIE